MARYLYEEGPKGEVVVTELTSDWRATRNGAWGKKTSEGEQYDGLRATDGADISSRKKRREYMKANGLGDPTDYQQAAGTSMPSYWDKAAETRRRRQRGEIDTSGGRRKELLARLVHQQRRG